MVFMKFREDKADFAFLHAYNGKLFNSMEPENCHVIKVKSVRFVADSTISEFQSKNLAGPFGIDTHCLNKSLMQSKPEAPPTPPLYELPTCPVCLERMDASITGLFTILCQHTFHCSCLTKWGDGSCPVCRYSQKDSASSYRKSQLCDECSATENLWICMICGSRGRGRYNEGHAYSHFLQTGHLYSMELETSRVWDYAGDAYVHRLIQNKVDGKVVELPSSNQASPLPENESSREKLEVISAEYLSVLTLQIESQRAYYEEKLLSLVDKNAQAKAKAEANENLNKELSLERNLLKQEVQNLGLELSSLNISQEKLMTKFKKLQKVCRYFQAKASEEEAINKAMRDNLKYNEAQVAENNAIIAELKDQIRDLTFALEVGKNEELRGGLIVTNSTAS
jgi:BRCA1-associated protein